MIVATDRISAFDVVMNEPVPGKGVVLSALTRFWLRRCRPATRTTWNTSSAASARPAGLRKAHRHACRSPWSSRRPMFCRSSASSAGIWSAAAGRSINRAAQRGSLAAGPGVAEKPPEPIFTPSTKRRRPRRADLSSSKPANARHFMLNAARLGPDRAYETARQRADIYRRPRPRRVAGSSSPTRSSNLSGRERVAIG